MSAWLYERVTRVVYVKCKSSANNKSKDSKKYNEKTFLSLICVCVGTCTELTACKGGKASTTAMRM